jgi:ATP-dependent protease HslVU (ClpYQ) peptidase subunit
VRRFVAAAVGWCITLGVLSGCAGSAADVAARSSLSAVHRGLESVDDSITSEAQRVEREARDFVPDTALMQSENVAMVDELRDRNDILRRAAQAVAYAHGATRTAASAVLAIGADGLEGNGSVRRSRSVESFPTAHRRWARRARVPFAP